MPKIVPQALKYAFEVRYSGAPLLFDKRGLLLDQFKDDLFTGWRIDRNRIDLHNRDRSIAVFASFTNAGAAAEDPPSFGFIKDHIQRWLKLITPEIGIKKIKRAGFRTTYLAPVGKLTFDQLFKYFTRDLFNQHDDLWGFSKAKLYDVGISFNAHIDNNKLNIFTGPMEQKQAVGFFETEKAKGKIPPLAVFFDIDYFCEEPSFNEQTLLQEIMKFIIGAEQDSDNFVGEFLNNLKFEEA